MKYIKIYLVLALSALFVAGCSDGDDSDDNRSSSSIISFVLKQNGLEFYAAVSSDKLLLTVPENLSLDHAAVDFVISTNAKISPDPATITNWDDDHTFTITSYSSQQTYTYHVERNIVSQDGDVTLLTQSDVENLASLNVSQINGNLVIGAASGESVIDNIDALSGLKVITGKLIVNPTYASENLNGLKNLEKIGGLELGAVKGMKEVSFPKLKTVVSNLVVKSTEVEALIFPELIAIERNLQIEYVNNLAKIEFPKLEMIAGNATLQSSNSTNTLQSLSFPVLSKIGEITKITDWPNLENIEMPELKSTLSLNITSLSSLLSFGAPQLESIYDNVSIIYCLKLSSFDLASLKSIPGKLDIENLALQNLEGLKSLESIGGELFVSDMAKMTATQGLNSLREVGARIYMSNIPLLADSFAGMAALSTVGGDIIISQIPFKKFSAFNLKSGNNISIYSTSSGTIEEIDVTNLTSVKTLSIGNMESQVKVKGPASFDGKLSIESSNVVLEGFNEVKELNYSVNSDKFATQTVGISKVSGKASISVYNFEKLIMPNLTEVGGELSLSSYSNMSLDLPKLKTCGSLKVAATQNDLISLPALETVNGDCKVTSADYQGSLGDLQMPALKEVNGKLDISGYSNYYVNNKITNLNSFSKLTTVKEVVINYNTALVDFTGLKNAIASITATTWKVAGNGYNPTYQQMVDGSWVKP